MISFFSLLIIFSWTDDIRALNGALLSKRVEKAKKYEKEMKRFDSIINGENENKTVINIRSNWKLQSVQIWIFEFSSDLLWLVKNDLLSTLYLESGMKKDLICKLD